MYFSGFIMNQVYCSNFSDCDAFSTSNSNLLYLSLSFSYTFNWVKNVFKRYFFILHLFSYIKGT